MKALFFLFALLLTHMIFNQQESFKAEQKKYSRVRDAYANKEQKAKQQLKEHGLQLADLNILLLAFKQEKEIELWGKSQADVQYKKIKTFAICASSGELGPKRKDGDLQVPEGFYYIDRFNPASKFHLSLGINYPNASDKALSPHPNLGGDIFIHGSCVTVGCLPITDDTIQELYIYAVEAKNSGQRNIPAYIFPTRLTDKAYSTLRNSHKADKDLLQFWSNLKEGYDRFTREPNALSYKINTEGRYLFSSTETVSAAK